MQLGIYLHLSLLIRFPVFYIEASSVFKVSSFKSESTEKWAQNTKARPLGRFLKYHPLKRDTGQSSTSATVSSFLCSPPPRLSCLLSSPFPSSPPFASLSLLSISLSLSLSLSLLFPSFLSLHLLLQMECKPSTCFDLRKNLLLGNRGGFGSDAPSFLRVRGSFSFNSHEVKSTSDVCSFTIQTKHLTNGMGL